MADPGKKRVTAEARAILARLAASEYGVPPDLLAKRLNRDVSTFSAAVARLEARAYRAPTIAARMVAASRALTTEMQECTA